MTRSISKLLPILLLSVIFGRAEAQLVQNLLIGNAKALALGNAVTADPPGIDSIHFNPAGLARISGRNYQLKSFFADADIRGEFRSNENYDQLLEDNNESDPIANTSSSIESFAFYSPISGVTGVPVTAGMVGGASYSPEESNLTYATAVYTPLIGGYIRDKDDPGRFYGQEAAISRITFASPTVGYKFSETLSLGAGVGLSYVGGGVSLDFRAPNVLLGVAKNITDAACDGEENGIVFEGVPVDICGGSISPFDSLLYLEAPNMEASISATFNLGVLWEPFPWLSIGGVYQSEAPDTYEGGINIRISDNLIGFAQGLADSNPVLGAAIEAVELTSDDQLIETKGDLAITLPAHFAIGVSLLIMPDLKLNVDWKWTEMSSLEEITINVEEPIPLLGILEMVGVSNVKSSLLTIPRGYKDATNFAFGLEYQYSDTTAFRLGYEPRDSGIPKNRLDFLVPIGDFELYGMGLAYQWDKESTIDFALAYGKSDQFIPAGSSTNGNKLSTDNFVYNPSAGLDVRSTIELLIFEMTYQTRF